MDFNSFRQRFQYNPSTDRLGSGGFGEVFKAYDTHRDRWVAIKIAKVIPDIEHVRLKKEVEVVSALASHSNIAYYETCYTFSSFDGEYDFAVLQYYEEGNLLQLLNKDILTGEQKEAILTQLLHGLNFLHTHGIIHRDLKPQNILIVKRGSEYIPKITDFGISKALDIHKSSIISNSIVGAGTLAYSSPEQLKEKEIRKNTDLWSFGVIAYKVFTGELPFTTGIHSISSEAGRLELFTQINKGELPEGIENLPESWQKIIRRCLVPEASRRIKSTTQCLTLLTGETEDTELLESARPDENKQTEITILEEAPVKKKPPVKVHLPEEKGAKPNSIFKLLIGMVVALLLGIGIYAVAVYTPEEKVDIIISSDNIPKDITEKYDFVADSMYNGLVVVEKNKKYGYINQEGKEIIPLMYDKALDFKGGLGGVKENDQWKFINNKNKIVSLEYDSVKVHAEGLARVMKDNVWGYVNTKGKETIPLAYNNALPFKGGIAPVRKNWKWGLIDKNGQEKVPYIYQDVRQLGKGMIRFQKEDKWGILNQDGEIVVDFIYDDMYRYYEEENIIIAELNGKEGGIDEYGNEKIPFIYDNIYLFQDGVARAEKLGKWGYLNLKGEELGTFIYDNVYSFRKGVGVVVLDEKSGLIYKDGRLITSIVYDELNFGKENDYIQAKKNGKYGYLNFKGEEISPFIYEKAAAFRDGLAAVALNGNEGYIDSTGIPVIPLIYSQAGSFYEGRAVVYNEDYEVGVINKKGEIVIPYGKFSGITTFNHGIAGAIQNDKVGMIDSLGNIVIPFEYDFIRLPENDILIGEKDNKYGFIDTKGNKITSFVYEEAHPFIGELAEVKKNGKLGFIDKNGREVIPPLYDAVGDFYIGNLYTIIHVREDIKRFEYPFEIDLKRVREYIYVWKDDKIGLVSKEGKVLIPAEYDTLKESAYSGLFKGKKGDMTVYIDSKGNIYSQEEIENIP